MKNKKILFLKSLVALVFWWLKASMFLAFRLAAGMVISNNSRHA
jgi:hypothetical protein